MNTRKRLISCATLGLLVACVGLAVSGCGRSSVAAAQPCANNLRLIEGAKAQWALQHHKGGDTNAVPTMQDLEPYISRPPTCPDGGTYTAGRIGEQPRCSLAGKLISGRIHTMWDQ